VQTYSNFDELRRLVKRNTYDLVYERYSLGGLHGAQLAFELGIPHVLEVNAPLYAEALQHRPHTVTEQSLATERELWSKADLVVTVSRVMSDLITLVRGTLAPTIVIRNGFDKSIMAAARRLPEARPSARPRLVFVGHPKPWHGAEILPIVVRELVEFGFDVECVVVGGGQLAERIQSTVKRLHITDRFSVTGEVSQLVAAAWLNSATLGVAPYPLQEPFYFCPIKIIEYLGAGLPIVTVDLGDIKSIAGDAAFYAEVDNPASIAALCAQLLRDHEWRDQLAVAARKRRKSFTWEHAAKQTIAAMTTLLQHPELA